MKYVILINYKWKTANTVENPFQDKSVLALNGIRVGKIIKFNDNIEDYEIKAITVEEFETANPDFFAKESILIVENSISEINDKMRKLPSYDKNFFTSF